MATIQDYYTILGVPKTATQEELRARYYELAKKYHPDAQPDAASKKIAEEEMAKLTDAYRILSDPQKRQELDKKPSIGTSIATRMNSGLSTLNKIMSNENVRTFESRVERNVGWSPEGFGRDVKRMVGGAQSITQPAKSQNHKKQKKANKEESGLSILKKRYARGEITEQQYLNMKRQLE